MHDTLYLVNELQGGYKMSKFIFYVDFESKIQDIVNKYTGKVNKNAYKDITNDIQKYLGDTDMDIYGGCIAEPGRVYIDTEEAGRYDILNIQIKWKKDKRMISGYGSNVESVEVISLIPDKWKAYTLPDMKQAATYELAKENRARLFREIEELKQEISDKEKAISSLEKTMRWSQYEKGMFDRDMREPES